MTDSKDFAGPEQLGLEMMLDSAVTRLTDKLPMQPGNFDFAASDGDKSPSARSQHNWASLEIDLERHCAQLATLVTTNWGCWKSDWSSKMIQMKWMAATTMTVDMM